MAYKTFDLKTFVDEKGSLTPMELKDLIDFDVKRVYTVHHNKTARGGHCHKVEEEFFFMGEGTCTAKIHNGSDWVEIEMNNEQALYVGQKVWHEFDNFSDGSVLVALSSTNYNPDRSDYVEDFNDFLEYVSV